MATKDNALAAIFDRLGDLSSSELWQLHLAIGVRLARQDGPTGTPGVPAAEGKSSRGGKPTGQTRGPPAGGRRKGDKVSQHANHPLWVEYNRLKRAVMRQAKEQKCSFGLVKSAEAADFTAAKDSWLATKDSFRGRQTTTEKGSGPASGLTTSGPANAGPTGAAPISTAKVEERAEQRSAGPAAGRGLPSPPIGRRTSVQSEPCPPARLAPVAEGKSSAKGKGKARAQ
jgi:hypothetical protein